MRNLALVILATVLLHADAFSLPRLPSVNLDRRVGPAAVRACESDAEPGWWEDFFCEHILPRLELEVE